LARTTWFDRPCDAVWPWQNGPFVWKCSCGDLNGIRKFWGIPTSGHHRSPGCTLNFDERNFPCSRWTYNQTGNEDCRRQNVNVQWLRSADRIALQRTHIAVPAWVSSRSADAVVVGYDRLHLLNILDAVYECWKQDTPLHFNADGSNRWKEQYLHRESWAKCCITDRRVVISRYDESLVAFINPKDPRQVPWMRSVCMCLAELSYLLYLPETNILQRYRFLVFSLRRM